jgi:uncharacterized membrane protein
MTFKRIRAELADNVLVTRHIQAAFVASFVLIAAASVIAHERAVVSLIVLVISLLVTVVLILRIIRAGGAPRGWALPCSVILALGVVIAVLQVTLATSS